MRAARGVLELKVCDDGHATAQAGDGVGRGIAGMRERAAILGGTLEATRRIVAAGSAARVIVLTTYDVDDAVFRALRAGASGFLLKDVRPAGLIDAVRVVAAGDELLAPSVTRRLLNRFADALPAGAAARPADLAGLTDREAEVLRLVALALSNAEIAERLVLTEATVKTHVSAVLRKLGLRDRVQAVVLAYDAGLVRPRSA